MLDKKIITGEKIITSGTQEDKEWENRKRDIKIKQLENRGDELTIGIKNNQQILLSDKEETKGMRYSVTLFFLEHDFQSYNLFYRTITKEITLVDSNGWP